MNRPPQWTEAIATASWAVWPALLGTLLSKGLLTTNEVQEVIDCALSSLEQLDAESPAPELQAARQIVETLFAVPRNQQPGPSA